MKKILLALFVILLSAFSFAQKQNEVRASMGIDFVSVPQLKDYIESISRETQSDFSSAINFSGSYGRMMSENSQLELEIGYLLNSYNSNVGLGNYNLSYSLLMPSVLYNYVINGSGYNFKFGGGAGIRLLSITEKYLPLLNDDYSKLGFGFILRGAGNTAIAQDVYAHIGADVRYDVIGKPDVNAVGNKVGNVNFSSLSFGIRLGISYQFWGIYLSFIEAIILGIVQGITEFLPISSTGHLTLAGKFMGLISEENPERWTAFIAVIQLGTMISILVYFWKDLWNIFTEFLQNNLQKRVKFSKQSTNSKLGWMIILGTIPIVVIGLLFKDMIEGALTKNLYVISGSLIVLAIILAGAEKTAKFKKNIEDITVLDSILIGLSQAVALIPGSSRSGTTITGGLFLGLKRDVAARFSFLLSVPAVLASGVLQLIESLKYINYDLTVNLIVATIVSAISGYLAIDFLLKFLKKNTTFIFIYYRIALGVLILVLLYSNIINP